MSKDLVAALWSLKEDSAWAWKQALEGVAPDVHALGLVWKRIEQLIIAGDNE